MRLEDSIEPRWYILSARSSIRFKWDVIIIFFAVINALTLPMEIAFEVYLDEIKELVVINGITTSIFAFDILVGFFTSYINVSTGDEIFGFQMIA